MALQRINRKSDREYGRRMRMEMEEGRRREEGRRNCHGELRRPSKAVETRSHETWPMKWESGDPLGIFHRLHHWGSHQFHDMSRMFSNSTMGNRA